MPKNTKATKAKKSVKAEEALPPMADDSAKVSASQKGGAKKVAAKKTVAPKKQAVAKKQAGGAKKTVAKKTAAPKKQAGGAKQTATQTATTTPSGKVVRSFKVQLPGEDEFSGRFTGSTPYQAANKALSKYYRTVDNPKSVITFSIRESTRGSKRNTYTYEGHRVKLETPVSYSIKGADGSVNTITKNHKNQLKKVKKEDLAKAE